jgi:hypothetical protein
MANPSTGKVFFFLRRNPITGEVIEDDYLDADEKTAWMYIKTPRFFKYIGWSDGHFFREVKKRGTIDPETRMMVETTEEHRNAIHEAWKKEIEFAKEHPQPPRNLSRLDIDGRPLQDPGLAGELSRLRPNG